MSTFPDPLTPDQESALERILERDDLARDEELKAKLEANGLQNSADADAILARARGNAELVERVEGVIDLVLEIAVFATSSVAPGIGYLAAPAKKVIEALAHEALARRATQ